MIFLYTVVLLLLGAVKLVVSRRAASLERKYSALAGTVLQRVHESTFKPGNGGKVDVGASAKRMLELGVLVQQRDELEGRYYRWRGWSDKLGRAVATIRAWKGKKLPYTLGVIDVWLVLYTIDHLGVAKVFSARHVIDSVRTWLGW